MGHFYFYQVNYLFSYESIFMKINMGTTFRFQTKLKIHAHIHSQIHTHSHIHTPIYTHINTHTQPHTYTYTHMHTHNIFKHVCKEKHKYTRIHKVNNYNEISSSYL